MPFSQTQIDALARRAGVSRMTVHHYLEASHSLSWHTRTKLAGILPHTKSPGHPCVSASAQAVTSRIYAALAQTKQTPALSTPPSSAGTWIALVYDGSDQAVFDLVANAMAAALATANCNLALLRLPTHDPLQTLRAWLSMHGPNGIVMLAPLAGREDLPNLCREQDVRCVRLGHTNDGTGIASDDRQAMANLVGWLVAQGHRRIALVAGPDGSPTARQRELGYLDAMADHDLDRGPALMIAGDHSFVSGIEAGRLLLEVSPRPSAIIAVNDEMAAGVLHAAALEHVAVPAMLSVVGFDDTALAERVWPPLTSVRVPWAAMATAAVASMLADEAPESGSMSCPTLLVERQSVAPRVGLRSKTARSPSVDQACGSSIEDSQQ